MRYTLLTTRNRMVNLLQLGDRQPKKRRNMHRYTRRGLGAIIVMFASSCKGAINYYYDYEPATYESASGMRVTIQLRGTPILVDSGTVFVERKGSPYALDIYLKEHVGKTVTPRSMVLTNLSTGEHRSVTLIPFYFSSDSTMLIGGAANLPLRYDDYGGEFRFTITDSTGIREDSARVILRRHYRMERRSVWDRIEGF